MDRNGTVNLPEFLNIYRLIKRGEIVNLGGASVKECFRHLVKVRPTRRGRAFDIHQSIG